MGVLDKIKRWLTKKPDKKTTQKLRDANRVSNYGGGVKRNDTVSEVKRSIYKAEKAQEKKQSTQTATRGSAFKATPPSVKKAEAKDKQTQPSKPTRSNAFKATPPPTFNYHSTALGTLSSKEKNSLIAGRALAEADKTMREYQAAKLKPLIESKYSGDTKESKQRIKSGEWMSDPNVAKYNVLKHPVAESLSRGGLSGATFGVSELLAAKAPRNEEWQEAERVYQKNKNALAEGVGELAGSLAGFGLTGGLSKAALQKTAPKLTAKLGASATERLAANKLVQNAARREALAVLGREATEKELANFARSRAAKLVAALGEDAAINLTTGAVADVSHAIIDSDNPAEFVKNMAVSAGMNTILGGAIPTVNLFRGGADSGIRRVTADEIASRATRNLDNSAERVNILDMARKPEVKAEAPKAPKVEAEPKVKAEAVKPKEATNGASEADSIRNRIRKIDEKMTYIENGSEWGAYDREDYKALQRERDELTRKLKESGGASAKPELPKKNNEQMTLNDFMKSADESKGVKADAEVKPKVATEPPKPEARGTTKSETPEPKAKKAEETRTVSNVESVVNKKKVKASRRERIRKGLEATRRGFVDSMNTFEKTNLKSAKEELRKAGNDKTLKKQIWGKWEAKNAATNKHRTYKGYAATSIKNAQLNANNRRYSGIVERVGADGKTYQIENGKSIMQIYDGMSKDKETAFEAYLNLKHAPDRIAEGTPIFDKIKLKSGESLNDVNVVNREAKRLLKENPEFAKKAEEIYQYTRNELQNRVDAGLLSQETADDWMKRHPFYVPTGRDGYFNSVHGNNKGVIGADSLKAATGSDLDIRSIKEQLAEATNRNWRDITANNLLEEYFGDEIGASSAVDDGLDLLNDTIGLGKSADGRKYYAKIFRDGKMHRVEIDKSFYDDLQDLYKNGSLSGSGAIGEVMDTVADAASLPSRLFKNLITTWNPIFMGTNFARDTGDALINTRQTKEFLECYPRAIKELAVKGKYLQALRDTGVSQSNFINLEESLLKSESKFKITGIAKEGLNKFTGFQEAIETLPRLTEFMATLKKHGVDLKDPNALEKVSRDLLDIAAANASDVTVNFDRGGSISKNLNRGLVPFFNPSIQGSSKFVRNFTEQPGLKPLLGVIGKGLALGAGVSAVNNYFLKDNPNYQKISARDKATNIIIAMPYRDEDGQLHLINNETDTFIKIPKGRFAAVYSIPTVNTNNKNKMGYAEMFKVVGDSVAPVDPIESTIFAPLLAAKNNKTWYGAPIVSDSLVNENNPSEEYDENTSPFGMALGKATSKLPKELQISPKRADYVIDATTGVIGDFGLPASKAFVKGDSVGDALLNVGKKAFSIDSVTRNDLATRFYDNLQKAEENLKRSDAGEAEQAEYDRYNGYRTEISGLNKAIRQLQNDNLKMNQDSIRELQKIRNDMTQDALDGKEVPSSTKTMDAVQKYVGTTYAVDNFGSTADKDAMKAYGEAKYGNISDAKMKKKIDSDPDFYKGVQSIHNVDDKMTEAGITSNSGLTKAIALADAGANEDLYGAYGCTNQSRTESANKMERAKTYMKNGGSVDEYVKMEKTLKTVSRLSIDDKDAEIEALDNQLAKGEITQEEYNTKTSELGYNPNTSYVGKATSLAQANCPERGYRLYDIKDKNIQKGINLAAMGFNARDYRDMSKAIDSDGNGYLKKQEIIDYVSNSNVEDKATLYNALYYYKGTYNPFGTPTNYTRAQAADEGKKQNVEWITDERDDIEVKPEESSGGYGGYYRYGRWHRWGRYQRKGRAKSMDKAAFAQKNIRTSAESKDISLSASSNKKTYKSLATKLKATSSNPRANYDTSSVKYQTAKAVKSAPKKKTTTKKTPPKVKFKKYEV